MECAICGTELGDGLDALGSARDLPLCYRHWFAAIQRGKDATEFMNAVADAVGLSHVTGEPLVVGLAIKMYEHGMRVPTTQRRNEKRGTKENEHQTGAGE